MCKLIEEYVEEQAVDAVISSFVKIGKTLEETIEFITFEYSCVTEENITERFNFYISKLK